MRTIDAAKDISLIHSVSFQSTVHKPQNELQNSLKQLVTKNLILSLLSMLLNRIFAFSLQNAGHNDLDLMPPTQ